MSKIAHVHAQAMVDIGSPAPRSPDAGSAHLATGYKSSDRPATSAFFGPGHTLYLCEPQKVSILAINIDATTTIITTRAAPSDQDQEVLLPESLPTSSRSHSLHPPTSPGYRHASTSKLHSPHPPSSSLNNPSSRSARSRPLSQDFGQKARDVFSEFGRLANRRTSAIERSNGADTLAEVADGLNASSAQSKHLRRASLQPLPTQQHPARPTSSYAEKTPILNIASDNSEVVRSSATQNLKLIPRSASSGYNQRLAHSAVPFDIQSRIIESDATSSTPATVEFVADQGQDRGASAEATACDTFDPSRLLLKVRPPAEAARDSWSRATSFITTSNACEYETSEDHAIKLRFRLRLSGSKTPTASSTPSSEQGLGQVLFLSAASPEKLAAAIECPQSSISTPELASLEGIVRIEVTSSSSFLSSAVARGARDCDFDWTWKSLARTLPGRGSRCCCAFVELHSDGTTASILAAFSYHVELPSPPAARSSMHSSSDTSSAPRAGLSRADSMALIAALNLDHDLSPGTLTPPTFASIEVESRAEKPSNPAEARMPQSAIRSSLAIDRTELALEDLVNDSPIFRAAVVNLERRTASMKKLSKAVLKAVQEGRLRILKLIEAEEAMNAAFEDLGSFAPQTLGRLQDQFLRQARASITQHYKDQVDIIERCLEYPLSQIADLCRAAQESFKLFDSESKAYYSQTQKWLANRSTSDTPSFPDNGHTQIQSLATLERMQKQDRADEKQKLRELRFEQARVDLFAVLKRLHGGKAEAHLAQCILQLSQWLADLPNTVFGPTWTDHQRQSGLTALDADLRSALDENALKLDQVEARSRDLGDKIRTLELSLGKSADADIDIVGAHRFELEQEATQVSASNGAHTSKARKFRSFLGSFAAGINNSPLMSSKGTSPLPESADSQMQVQPSIANASELPQKPDTRRRLSLKLKSNRGQQSDSGALSPNQSQAPSSWRHENLAAPPHRGSEVPNRRGETKYGDGPDRPAAGRQATTADIARKASDTGFTLAGDTGFADTQGADRGLGIYEPPSPTFARLTAGGAMPVASPNPSTPSPRPGGERKKEGVLWVMSKSVTGPAGADAPRGVNRSTHWRECWVVLSGSGQISEFADWKNAKVLEPTNPLIDLRFATVREARGVDRRFTFEIVTRDNRRFFQAHDEDTMRDWMRAISKAIESLLNGTSSVRKLDRAVRATPFRNLDSAERAGTFEEMEEELDTGEGNDFAVRRLLDGTGKAFSQSMTDLSASAQPQGHQRRDSTKLGAHLATLSEGFGEPSARFSKRNSRHQRGISNKTPISGYLGAGALGLSPADAAALHSRDGTGASDDGSYSSFSASAEHATEFDREIEAVIHRSYGSNDGTGTSHSAFSHSSGGVDEMGMLNGSSAGKGTASSDPARGAGSALSSNGRSALNGSLAGGSTSSKMSRSAEIAAISRQPENRRCADCQDSDPRWASWMLANEPCCIFICIGCSGVHRSLGVHISKVKSVDLDDWTEAQLQAARDWGNARANAVWEHSKPAGLLPTPDDRKEFWRIKYVEQQWKAPNDLSHASPFRQQVRPTQSAAFEDVDATPTRRSVMVADPSAATASLEGSSQHRPKAMDLRITTGDQQTPSATPAHLVEGFGSPRPNGPRPLPNRRSVSMQSVPTSSPPQSPQSPNKLISIDQSRRSPISPSRREKLDWSSEGIPRRYRPDNDDEPAGRTATESPRKHVNRLNGSSPIPASISVPQLSMSSPDSHISQAMRDARADARLFPVSSPATQHLQPIETKNSGGMSSPPSSFFVSNLDGPLPSPTFFDRPSRDGEPSWDTGSEARTGSLDDRRSTVESPSDPPARFEPFVASD